MIFKFDINKVGRNFENYDDGFQDNKTAKGNKKEKNKRPKKDIRENRINLRFNDKEYEILKQKADGMSLAPFLRSWVLTGKMPKRKKDFPKIDPVLIRQITSMSNNLNQLTRYAHTQNATSDPIDILQLAINIELMQKELQELKKLCEIK